MDLTSLILNVMMYKLATALSLDAKLVMAQNGKHIFITIRSDLKDLKQVAEDEGFNVQLAIGITDLASLEPCNS